MTAGELIKALSKVPPEREVEIHYEDGCSPVYTDGFEVYAYDHYDSNFATVVLNASPPHCQNPDFVRDLTEES